MATYCTQYIQSANHNLPMVNNNWNPGNPAVHVPFYTQQMPLMVIIPTTIPQLYPCITNTYTPPQTFCMESVPKHSPEFHTNLCDGIPNQITTDIALKEINTFYVENEYEKNICFASELFPSPKMFLIDPNPIIDEFCKQPNIEEHAAWIMDLELGIPREPTTRLIPVYDVKYNSIQCKNTPAAIHPGFATCSEMFKRVLLFYYDSIISTWYRSYVIISNDTSVDNFQKWLLTLMQLYGMCWPKRYAAVVNM